MKLKKGSSTAPVANMWCAHTATDSAAMPSVREHHAAVPEHGFAGEHRDDLGDDAEERQRDDVHLGMPEEPEQMLLEDRAAVGRVEHMGPEMPVRGQARAARRSAPGTRSGSGSR